MRTLIIFLLIFNSLNVTAQKGHILVVSNANATIIVDGDELQNIDANTPSKLELSAGEHYLQVITLVTKKEKNEIIKVEDGKQKVLKYEFDDAHSSTKRDNLKPEQLANLSVNIPSEFNSLLGDYETSGVPIFYYHFLKDDKLIVNFKMSNKNGTNTIEVVSYPDGNRVFSNAGFQNLENLIVKIPADGIYRISFGTNHMFGRSGQLVFERIPGSTESLDHNTKVVKKRRFDVVHIQEPSDQWVNSSTSLTGTTRIVIPINLPVNTVEWYYIVSASRSKENIEANLKNVSLVKDLSKALSGVNPTTMALNMGLDLISQPPGSDYCDVFLIDHDNYQPFTNKLEFRQYTEGTRTNITSAKVKVTGLTQGQFYLGLRNNDVSHGISIGVEVAAIVAEDYYGKAE